MTWPNEQEYIQHILKPEGLLDYGKLECQIRGVGGIQPLANNSPQTLVCNTLIEALKHSSQVQIDLLKVRQFGGTTVCAQICSQASMAWPGTNGLVASNDRPNAIYTLDMYRTIYENLGVLGNHFCITEPDSTYTIGLSNASIVYGMTAGNPWGKHGRTYAWTHLAEIARYKNIREVLKGIKPAARQARLQIEESTAAGRGGYFYERWLKGQTLDEWIKAPPEKRRHINVFIPWFMVEEYKIDTDPKTEAAVTANPSAAVIESTITEAEADAIRRHGLTYGQTLWARQTLEDVCHGRIEDFNEQYPATPEEAFIAGGDAVFTPAAIQRLERCCSDPHAREDSTDTWIWYDPEPGRRYIAAVDSAAGIQDRDLSVVQILRVPDNPGEEPLQCAEHMGCTKPRALAAIACRLSKHYHNALQWIERNGLGLATINATSELGYHNVHGDGKQLGFHMTEQMRDSLWSYARDLAETTTGIRSRRLVHQIASLQWINDRIDHPQGSHDDAWSAYCMGVEASRKAGYHRPSARREPVISRLDQGFRGGR